MSVIVCIAQAPPPAECLNCRHAQMVSPLFHQAAAPCNTLRLLMLHKLRLNCGLAASPCSTSAQRQSSHASRMVRAPAPSHCWSCSVILQAYAAGLTFALAASPCSTPVLATLLAYVSTAQRPLEGGGLLLAYTSG